MGQGNAAGQERSGPVLPALNATSGMKSVAGFNARSRTGGGGGQRAVGAGARPAASNFVAMPSRSGGSWPDYRAAAADVCLWDILGKAVDRPIYKLLGGTKDRMAAYASSLHLDSIEDYVPDALKAKEAGYKGYKIHPGAGQHKDGPPIPSYVGHMEEIRQLRKALGDEYVIAHDPVQAYNRFEAMKVGRLLDELDYAWFEDPIRTVDMEGLVELARALDVPLHVGEFLGSISDFAEYIKHGAIDVVRPDLGQRRRHQRVDAGRLASRCVRPGMHTAQLGQCDRSCGPFPSGTGSSEHLLV